MAHYRQHPAPAISGLAIVMLDAYSQMLLGTVIYANQLLAQVPDAIMKLNPVGVASAETTRPARVLATILVAPDGSYSVNGKTVTLPELKTALTQFRDKPGDVVLVAPDAKSPVLLESSLQVAELLGRPPVTPIHWTTTKEPTK